MLEDSVGGTVRPPDPPPDLLTDPATGATVAGAGGLLWRMRDGMPRTRSELAAVTGLARSTIAQRVDALMAAGFIGPAGEATSPRPPCASAAHPKRPS